ncbi:hypothetical protein QZH41_020431, partial [Actinostola sp. cb2023]
NGNCNEENMVDHENDELFDALAKIEELAKAKDEETVNNATQITAKTEKGGGGAKQYQPTRPRVVPSFSNNGFRYEAQFEMVADLNNWNSEEKAAYLAVSLVGQARTVLGDLSGEERRNFKSLTAALATRFGTENKTEMFRVNVNNRQREKDESLPELAQAIRRLTRQAYPSAAVDLRDILARDYFLDAITETDMRWKIRQARPKSLNEALGVAVELEAFMSAEKQRQRSARAAQVTTNSAENDKTKKLNDDLREEIEELKRLVQGLGAVQQNHQRFRGDGCWACGDKNHLRRDCPKRAQTAKQQVNSPCTIGKRQPAELEGLNSVAKQSIRPNNPAVKSGKVKDCNDGLYIMGYVQGVPVNFLIDTGANITIIKSVVIEQIPQSDRPLLEDAATTMVLANGSTAPFQGCGMCKVRVGNIVALHPVWVADIEPEGILGLDFLRTFGGELVCKNGSCELQFDPATESSEQGCRRVVVESTTVIPPGSELIVPGRFIDPRSSGSMGVLEPSVRFAKTQSLLLAKTLVNTEKEVVPLRVLNVTNTPCTLWPHRARTLLRSTHSFAK